VNIFLLDEDIEKCAKYHCDKHVVKMILESAQILCSSSNLSGLHTPYRSTHIKHPCVIWAMASIQNWNWLKKLTLELNKEFKYRFDRARDHKAYEVVACLKDPELPETGLTEHPQVMPDLYKTVGNPVQAYRNYYVGSKRMFATWKLRKTPKWYSDMIKENKND
jgi:hypothetical protein